MAITLDGNAREIFLDGAPIVSVRDIYSAWVSWSASNLQWLPAFVTIADPPTVPVYATLVNGWKVRPLAGLYTLTLNDGFLYTEDNSDPIGDAHGGSQSPRVVYSQPVLAVGFSTGSPQQADIDAIRNKTDQIVLDAGRVLADIRAVRGISVNGTGTPSDPWGP